MYAYDDAFYQYTNKLAVGSARSLLPVMVRLFPISSVVDFGCGQGAWLRVWRELGIDDVLGVDGDYVNKDALLIASDRFVAHDLSARIDLGRKFDLVQSLEVAEHLSESVAGDFVETLTKHGEIILFSAAVPGQGGENHINEQPYEYWRDKFSARGYILVDVIRPSVKGIKEVQPWYKYNTFLYLSKQSYYAHSVELGRFRIRDTDHIPDISPFGYRIRKALLKLLSSRTMTKLSRLQARHSVK